MTDHDLVKTNLVEYDPWLEPFADSIEARKNYYLEASKKHLNNSPYPCEPTKSHEWLGAHQLKDGSMVFREWAPHAKALFLMGEFNEWNRSSHSFYRIEAGCWEIKIENSEDLKGLKHESLWKLHIIDCNEQANDRISPYARRVVQDEATADFCSQLWLPETSVEQKAFKPSFEVPYIYEAHIGMATENEGVGSFSEFSNEILPRIVKQGYNTVQLMAVMEHPFYGSYGYHVSSFFAPSSRFGTPCELKALVEKAHELGVAVIIDLVHSHAVKNFNECFNRFDGSEDMYFHAGGRGYHKLWDSMLFNYEKPEVIQFLLSNVRYWLEEFNLDGFRFDGITSMLYLHHGHYVDFDNYEKYFKDVDGDAFFYLQLANRLIHEIRSEAMSIAEDMSGMPGLGLPQEIGGLGFDYRLGMGIPDYWIKILKEQKDEEWNLDQLWHELSSRRHEENTIAYCESHDQALVGDKTIAFRLMDKEMYWHMQVHDDHPVISRGIALHKLIRLITLMVGGEAWLNFIGNEFGHPEWIDFPREGNNWSYQHARRQWSLVDNSDLKYKYLNEFDQAMLEIVEQESVLSAAPARLLNIDHDNKVLAFERAGLVVVFNFNVVNSLTDYRQGVPSAGSWEILLSSDELRFGGGGHQNLEMHYPTKAHNIHACTEALDLYLISRSVIVLRKGH